MNDHNLNRFLAKTNRPSSERCWEWTGRKNQGGYGLFVMGHSKAFLAHRISYEHWRGPFSKEKKILHRCDNPPCVNPDHLFVGTQADNVADMVSKGRHVCVPKHGEQNPMSKLTRVQVASIRKRYRPMVVTLKQLAMEFGVSEANLHMIVKCKRWKP